MDPNRFAPPGAQVADFALGSGVQPIRLWPPSGRIGRLRLLAYGVGLYLIFIIVSGLLGVVAGFAGSPRGAAVVGILLLVVYLGAATVLMIQRSHDMNLSGWWSIAAFVPLIGLVWIFKGGTAGANRWGEPPPPNGWFVRIVALIVPVVMVVGIVAAIALPAYVDYSARAKAGVTR